MLQVSGPVSISIFNLPDDRKIMLFGDYHQSQKGLCRPRQSINSKRDVVFITEFIDSLSSPTEVFLESDWVSDIDKHREVEPQEEDNVLQRVLNHYREAMYLMKGRRKDLKVHFTDVRALSGLSYLNLTIDAMQYSEIDGFITLLGKHPMEDIIKYYPTLKAFKRFANIMIKSDDYKQDMNTFMKGFRVFTGSNVLASAPGQTERKVHRIRKQLLKLSVKDRRILMSYHRRKTQELHDEYELNYNKIIKKIKEMNDLTKCDKVYFMMIARYLLYYSAHIMDMYALARMVHYIRSTKSKNFVFYAGAAHTRNYTRFFNEFWQKEATLVHHQQEKKKSPFYRCVSIPTKVLQ